MKIVIHYLLFLGLFFLHPSHVFSIESNKNNISKDCFQKMQAENSVVSADFQNSIVVFEDDLLDDDDEVTFLKKKNIYTSTSCFDNYQPFLNFYNNNLHNKIDQPNFSYSPFSKSISIRVLKL